MIALQNIIMLVEINNNINYIKTLWDFSNVDTQTEKNQKLDLCIKKILELLKINGYGFLYLYLLFLYVVYLL